MLLLWYRHWGSVRQVGLLGHDDLCRADPQ